MVSGRVVVVHHDRRGMVVAVRSGVVAIMARVVAVGGGESLLSLTHVLVLDGSRRGGLVV
jgi:hypothetical protein